MSLLEIVPLGDSALLVRLGDAPDLETSRRVRALAARLEAMPGPGTIEVAPALAGLAVFYDAYRVRFEIAAAHVRLAAADLEDAIDSEPEVVDLPVAYGGPWGPDLAEVADRCGLTPDEVIRIHASGEYRVAMIGFLPGFPYLIGMSPRIAVPRRDSPRPAVAKGSVGIAGAQTGIYPVESPGGWRIIGRTPVALFRPDSTPPSRLRAGDLLRFRVLTADEFDSWRDG